jgi:hypothetical protein
MGQSATFQLSTDPSNSSLLPGSRPSVGKEMLRPTSHMSLPEEDPERTKHSKMKAPRAVARVGSSLPMVI